ncbi:sir2 family histone [Ophiostoma piceae UAMH 11346]|uniref:Sir2 family histone n=1 Tax=Ophiostoma piceae (strain UAMH 11346) TaxID=1262450 RepID=S3BU99_OPHP1|nr:sir2 family histone [Ophiostoma piceae UAMH 11346]
MPIYNDIAAFHSLLRSIAAPGNPRPARIMALCGAGLSAASGLATFRGSTAALWHTHNPMELATPEAFEADPGLVWRFYAYRRHTALAAQPNAGHRALAALATALGSDEEGGPRFLCLTQNVDGLSERANHPASSLHRMHGSLFDLRCTKVDSGQCDYATENHFEDPLCPALSFTEGVDELARLAKSSTKAPAHIQASELPQCRKCNDGSLLRPGIVWFGERLDEQMLGSVDQWIQQDTVDLLLVVGTTAELSSALGFIDDAREAGAVVATITLDVESLQSLEYVDEDDLAFVGSAADLLPLLLEPVIGMLGK